ncbi:hypothetical protein RRF57_009428 [Xylaria bambusicola]|uniref:Uncharacterized protein n=1 Tax=Xylaria bambusicola TaxID=326684 RepID=A0AAN7UTJ6_9PEZI
MRRGPSIFDLGFTRAYSSLATFFALLIQASGGGISFGETAPADRSVSTGQSTIIAGLALQVFPLTIFFVLFLGVLWPTNLFRPKKYGGELDRDDRRTRRLVIFIFIAILLIICRSIPSF